MARMILKWRYIKAGTPKHGEHLVKYIATREGVEKCDESWKNQNATVEQQRLIEKLIRDFPEAKDSFEYQDYCESKTKYNASEFISRTIDENVDLIGRKENYVGYIAMRPRVEKLGTHGLFSQDDTPINLSEVSKTVAEHQGLVWTTVISLRREDAERLGYDNAKAWRDMLRSQADKLAGSMGIPLADLRWYAAFHNEGNHPHIHLISYSVGKEPYMTEQGLMKMKANYSHEIFKQDLYHIYREQTAHRDELKRVSKEQIASIIEAINRGAYENETVELMLRRLADELKDYSGKKVYGYLPKSCKNLVNGIVDELAKDERIAKLYDLWYEQKENILKTYTQTMPDRIPLSQNEEFKSIRNAIVTEAFNLALGLDVVEEPEEENIPDREPTEDEVESVTDEDQEPRNKWELYRRAKELLDEDSEGYDPNRAVEYLIDSANQNNTVAKYLLGKLFLKGEHIPQNVDYALRWLEEAVEDGNTYAEYLLGKTLLKGEDTEQDAERAEDLLRRSADQGNRYAAYTLGKALLDGDVLPQDIPEAIRLLKKSADSGFSQAQYVLGKLLYRGELTEQDIPKALEYLEKASAQKNPYAAYLAGRIRLTENAHKDIAKAIRHFEIAAEGGNDYAEYQLGKLYLYGKDIPQDYDKAIEYLTASAEHGNKYAEQLLHNIKNNRNLSAGMGVFRLFHHLGRLLRNQLNDDRNGTGGVDRKLRRQINEKKQAQGLKLG